MGTYKEAADVCVCVCVARVICACVCVFVCACVVRERGLPEALYVR